MRKSIVLSPQPPAPWRTQTGAAARARAPAHNARHGLGWWVGAGWCRLVAVSMGQPLLKPQATTNPSLPLVLSGQCSAARPAPAAVPHAPPPALQPQWQVRLCSQTVQQAVVCRPPHYDRNPHIASRWNHSLALSPRLCQHQTLHRPARHAVGMQPGSKEAASLVGSERGRQRGGV